ncbi:MAG: hypothetical protein JW876_06055 [Candidatus Krumholzibacteriota bacterium]|nr:hypothetical protein [Candidatus Krumholzibacteriota bacterium]
MRTRRRYAIPALLALAAVLVFAAACEREETDPAKRVVMRAVKKMGGLDRLRGWTTRIERGHLTQERPGWGTLNAQVTSHVAKPDRVRLDQDFSAFDHPFYYVYYLNGDDAWMVVNMQERRHPRVAENLEGYLERVDGLAWYAGEADTFFLVADVADDSLLAAASIERIGCVHEGDTVFFDFDRESGMLRRLVEDGGASVSLYDDYRPVGRMKLAFHVLHYAGGVLESEYRWDSMEYDTPIEDAVFEENRPAPEPEPEAESGT